MSYLDTFTRSESGRYVLWYDIGHTIEGKTFNEMVSWTLNSDAYLWVQRSQVIALEDADRLLRQISE